jgi:hypothetical protein
MKKMNVDDVEDVKTSAFAVAAIAAAGPELSRQTLCLSKDIPA